MNVTTVDGDADVVPEGYTPEDVAQCKALTEQIVASLQGIKGHVALSAVLTTYVHMIDGYEADQRFRAGQHLIIVGANIANAAIDAGGVCKDPGENATAIAQQLSNMIATKRHGPTLDALLLVFKTLARKFPCCAGMAAAGAAQAAIELTGVADAAQPVGSSQRMH
jgi:hypothetical protein